MSAAALQKLRPATIDDLLALPGDGQGYEILDGELAQKETSCEHSRAQAVFPSGTVFIAVPDWICEVLSSNYNNDTIKKKRIYHQAHVGHYWLMDPIEETLQVYRWDQAGYVEILSAERTEKVRAEPFEADETPVGVFFGDDEEE